MSLLSGARKAVNVCMGVRRGEKVLIVTDTEKERIGNALFKAAVEAKSEAIMVKMQPRTKHGEEPPTPIAELMKQVDVVLAPTQYSLTHTKARAAATKAGVRIATMPGITEQMISSGGMLADFKKIKERIMRVYTQIKNSKRAELYTPLGTDFSLALEGREWDTEDTGICRRKGIFTNLPAGELFIAPREGTGNGKLVIDGAFAGMLRKPVEIEVKNGYAERINNSRIANMLREEGREAHQVAELGIGMNPKSKVIGNVLEDEKALGTVHLAFGDNSTIGGKIKCSVHLDGVMTKPTLIIDGKKILEGGKLQI